MVCVALLLLHEKLLPNVQVLDIFSYKLSIECRFKLALAVFVTICLTMLWIVKKIYVCVHADASRQLLHYEAMSFQILIYPYSRRLQQERRS